MHGNDILSARFLNDSESFQLTFDFIKLSEHKKHIIYFYSFSSLPSIKNCKTEHPYQVI
jgi:hypothetical protein